MKIAIVGAGHWHVSIYYLPALKKLGADIVALADPSQEVLDKLGQEVDCPKYTDYRELLDAEEVDLVFAHAPHREMTAVGAELVARHQPFHMEKPMGVDWRKLEPVAAPPLCSKGEARIAAAKVDGVEIHNIYVPAGVDIPDPVANPKFAHKLGFLDVMQDSYGKRAKTPLVLVGDLNEILERPRYERPFLLLVVGYPAPDAQVPVITKKPLSGIATFR